VPEACEAVRADERVLLDAIRDPAFSLERFKARQGFRH
jgi:hypothetical protein